MPEYLQGRFNPRNPLKYHGRLDQIFFRSSYELSAFRWLDETTSVIQWSSEEIVIPYLSPVDKRMHRYFVDIWAEIKDKQGQTKRFLLEIKPKKETEPPKKRRGKRFIEECETFARNTAKWDAAQRYAKTKGWEFKILTETELFGQKVL